MSLLPHAKIDYVVDYYEPTDKVFNSYNRITNNTLITNNFGHLNFGTKNFRPMLENVLT